MKCLYIFIYSFFDLKYSWGFPGGSDSKESACDAGDSSSIPGSGSSPGEGKGYPPQYSCLEQRGLGAHSLWGHEESDATGHLTLS